MLIFGHLCIGAVVGLYLFRATKNPAMVLIASVGSLLPDLIDKPLEVLGAGDILGYEALFLHTFLAFVILGAVGILSLRLLRSPVPAVVAGMVGLHQVMDLMWTTPEKWLYPFLGPIPQSCSCLTPSLLPAAGGIAVEVPVNFIWRAIQGEILSPSEWVFLLVLALILLYPRLDGRAILWGSGLLALLSIASLAPVLGMPVALATEDGMAMEDLLLVVSVAGAAGLWFYDRWDRKGQREQTIPASEHMD
jgi:membrane-bound metal-dependent hydrolase YbcI (DUF457 family)